VGAHLNVNWVDATVPGLAASAASRRDAYQQLADTIPVVRQSGLPSLIFVISDEVTRRGRKDVPTSQNRDSGAAWIELFQSEGDYTVFIPGRFYNILRVDATRVTADDNKYLCSENAPIVLLTRADGQVETCFEKRAKIKRAAVVRAMLRLLQKDALVKNMQPFGKLHDLMKRLERAEMDLLKSDEKLQDLRKKLADSAARDLATARRRRKPAEPSKTTLMAEAAVDAFRKSTIYKGKVARYNILKEEYTLLLGIGLPSGKMPKAPSAPQQVATLNSSG